MLILRAGDRAVLPGYFLDGDPRVARAERPTPKGPQRIARRQPVRVAPVGMAERNRAMALDPFGPSREAAFLMLIAVRLIDGG